MAWEHVRHSLTDGGGLHRLEVWSGEYTDFQQSWPLFTSRFLSLVCGPGLFYTTGLSMSLFATSRRKRGWGQLSVTAHFVARGVVLGLLGRVVQLRYFLELADPVLPLPARAPAGGRLGNRP